MRRYVSLRHASLWLTPVVILAAAPLAWAHFRLLEPQSWIVENNLGDRKSWAPAGV